SSGNRSRQQVPSGNARLCSAVSQVGKRAWRAWAISAARIDGRTLAGGTAPNGSGGRSGRTRTAPSGDQTDDQRRVGNPIRTPGAVDSSAYPTRRPPSQEAPALVWTSLAWRSP